MSDELVRETLEEAIDAWLGCPAKIPDADARALLSRCLVRLRRAARAPTDGVTRLVEAAIDAYHGQYSTVMQHNLINATRFVLNRGMAETINEKISAPCSHCGRENCPWGGRHHRGNSDAASTPDSKGGNVSKRKVKPKKVPARVCPFGIRNCRQLCCCHSPR